MTTPEEMDESLWRFWNAKALKQADRIEQLMKERDEAQINHLAWKLEAEATQASLNKAVEVLRFLIEATTVPEVNTCITRALADARAVLAELEGK